MGYSNTIKSDAGDFAACGRRVSFWMPRKKPKRHQGAAQDERFALIFAAPGPHFTGPPMREAGNHRKGAGGHGIGFRSITAAAERPVTFGWHFSWLKARLLRGLGSSAVQRIGGRPSVPSPQNTGTIRSFRRGRSQTGPRAAKGRPTAENRPGALVRQRQARLWNRTNSNFPKTQGPVARREFRHSLRFCAPEMFCPPQGVTPVMGVLGGI